MSNDRRDLWETRALVGGIELELRAGDHPSLVLIQHENRVQIDLTHAKAIVAALVDEATDLATLLAAGGQYHG